MIRLDKVDTIDGVTVYGDERDPAKFYPLAAQPYFRISNGTLNFKFVKFRALIDKDNRKVGGICNFDTEFAVPKDKLASIKEVLQSRVNRQFENSDDTPPEVTFGSLRYTKGSANLLISDENNVLVEKVRGAGKPSLYGNNVASFSVDLSEFGAPVFEAALQGQGGFVQVVYDLYFSAKLPPIKARGWFNAAKFYSFFQEIDIEERVYNEDSYEETIREKLVQREARGTFFEWGEVTDEDIKQQIRASVEKSLDAAIERNLIEQIPPAERVGLDLYKDQDIEDVKKFLSVHRVSSVNIQFTENQVIEHNIAPNGMLPNITTMTGPDGENYRWEDFALTVDANDDFFKQLDVAISCNADFDNLPIHSIEVFVEYKHGDVSASEEFVFRSADDVSRFVTFTHDNHRRYKYSYQVNYKGESRTFNQELTETEGDKLVINVDDLGIWTVDIGIGDVNFAQVDQAQVALRYEDTGVDLIEKVFTIDKDTTEHSLRELIFEPRRKPYLYKVKYFMKDGKEFEQDWHEGHSDQLYINDPFSATRTVGLRAVGDLTERIERIFLDLKYVDAKNDYNQTLSIALSKDKSFHDWAFPVIDEVGGVVSYVGSIQFRDGTMEAILETLAETNTIQVGEIVRGHLEVEIITDLIDFSEVRLVRLALRYIDEANEMMARENFILRGAGETHVWKIGIKDRNATTYQWSADFFMADGSRRKIEPTSTSDTVLVIEPPAA